MANRHSLFTARKKNSNSMYMVKHKGAQEQRLSRCSPSRWWDDSSHVSLHTSSSHRGRGRGRTHDTGDLWSLETASHRQRSPCEQQIEEGPCGREGGWEGASEREASQVSGGSSAIPVDYEQRFSHHRWLNTDNKQTQDDDDKMISRSQNGKTSAEAQSVFGVLWN